MVRPAGRTHLELEVLYSPGKGKGYGLANGHLFFAERGRGRLPETSTAYANSRASMSACSANFLALAFCNCPRL